ncbi:MAG: M16 family metallopeptidase, partial [Steroidobacteraceae bacterium]
NGTTRRQPGEFDRLMEAQGGANNAFTTDDVTVYQDWFPNGALDLVFDLESDRVANLAFVPQVIESERGVVASERRLRVDDNNPGFLGEQVQAAAFVAHPYRFPTIGWPADIQAWQRSDLQKFFKTYYAPNNLTLALAGDLVPERVFELARKYFEPIAPQAPPGPVRAREPRQLAERVIVVRRKAQTPLLQCAYKAPAAADPRGPAVNLLLSILIDGDASRLHRALVEDQQVAIEVSGHWQEGFDPGLLWLYLTLPEGADPTEARDLLDAQLADVARNGVTAAELSRAKNLSAAGFWKKLATIDGKAQLLGEYEVFHGDWARLFAAPAQFEKVTREDVHTLAREILDPRRRTVGILMPEAEEGGLEASAAGGTALEMSADSPA